MTTGSGTFEKYLSINEQIEKQQKLEGSPKGYISVISTPLVAKAHTPVYTMHRFFARRPYNVFETLIKHYTNPGDIVLDPFMGGGVTVVESLRACRKVVGVDLNPIAWFIADTEVRPVDLEKMRKHFLELKTIVKNKIYELYSVICDNCHSLATVKWSLWSEVILCPQQGCAKVFPLSEAKKVGPGRYVCPFCGERFSSIECKHVDEAMVRIKYACAHCGKSLDRAPTTDDVSRYQMVITRLKELTELGTLWYPLDEIPNGDRVRDDALYRKGYNHFYQLFTKRNLLANSMLKKAILEMHVEPEIRKELLFVFSSSLTWSCKMRKDVGHGWEHHGYWLPDVHYESNVWDMFQKQFDRGPHSFWKGKTYSNQEFGDFTKFADDFIAIEKGEATCLLLCQSSHKLPIPDNLIDVVITDPPFGGNVQYAELADFWAVWLKEAIGVEGVIDNTFEAIQTRNTGFPTAKSLGHYEDMLFKVFKECHRVLKENRWMVLTFHNRDLKVWMALHRAALKAGFKLPTEKQDPNRGMLYQPPIEHYTTTMHQRAAGAMLGDFILSFKRQATIPYEITVSVLSTDEEQELVDKAKELIHYHAGADDSTLMTGLIPFLTEKNLLHKLATKDFKSFFGKHFVWLNQEKKWFTKEMVDLQAESVKPIDFIPAEKLTEEIVYSFLKEKQYATLDEVVAAIYSQLINSYRPGTSAINRVLERLCNRVPLPGYLHREGFTLKLQQPEALAVKKPEVKTQMTLFGTSKMVTALDHNGIIELICSYATDKGYEVHIGETEQNKVQKFKKASRQMLSYMEFGLPPDVFNTIIEVDLLLLKGTAITHAFEVATTVETANKAVNDRYRNMFIAMPNLSIRAYLVVRDKDAEKAHKIVYSKANVKDGVSKKVSIVHLSDLTEEKFEQLL